MGKLDKYVCDGQMDIFSFLDKQEPVGVTPVQDEDRPDICQDCIFQWLELPDDGFGCHYDTNHNICYQERMFKASEGWHLVKARPPYTVPMELPTNKDWKPVQVLLYNPEYDKYVIGDHWLAKDKTFKSYLPEPFGGVVAWRYK